MRINSGDGRQLSVRPCIGVIQTDGNGLITNQISLCDTGTIIPLTGSFVNYSAKVAINQTYKLLPTDAIGVCWKVVTTNATPYWCLQCGKDLVVAARLPVAASFELGERGATSIVGGATNGYDAATRTLTFGADGIAAAGGLVTNGNANALTNFPNAIIPEAQGNISGTWAVDFTKGGVQSGVQTDTITNVTFTVSSTNAESAVVWQLFSNGSSVTWNTNTTTFVGGTAPTLTSNEWNRIFINGFRDRYFVGWAGSAP